MSLFRFDLPEDRPGLRQEQPSRPEHYRLEYDLPAGYFSERYGELRALRAEGHLAEPILFFLITSHFEQWVAVDILNEDILEEERIEVLAELFEAMGEIEMAELILWNPLHYTQLKTLGRHLLLALNTKP